MILELIPLIKKHFALKSNLLITISNLVVLFEAAINIVMKFELKKFGVSDNDDAMDLLTNDANVFGYQVLNDSKISCLLRN